MILKDPNFVESSEHSTHNTEQTPCMLKFKNHFDLLVAKKKPHQKTSDIVCMRNMFLME